MKTRRRFGTPMRPTGEKARDEVITRRSRQQEQILRLQLTRTWVAIEIFVTVNFAGIQKRKLLVTLRVGSPNAFIFARPFKHSLRVRVSVRNGQGKWNPFVEATAGIPDLVPRSPLCMREID